VPTYLGSPGYPAPKTRVLAFYAATAEAVGVLMVLAAGHNLVWILLSVVPFFICAAICRASMRAAREARLRYLDSDE
jgi:hypothetical protein